MNRLLGLARAIGAELLGLFVDDWAFALGLLVWVGLFALPQSRALGLLAGPTLFLGLAALTLGFVARKSKR